MCRTIPTALIAVLALLATAPACSGDDDAAERSTTASPTSPTTASTTTAPSTTDPPTTEPPATAPSSPPPPTPGPPSTASFTVHEGDLVLDTDNEVIDGLHVQDGVVTCDAADVTLKNSKVTGPDVGIVAHPNCTGLLIEHVEIDCGNAVGSTAFGQNNGFVGQNIVIRNANIHGCENGVFIDNGVDVFDSWIHEPLPVGDTETGAHSDGIQFWGGGSDSTIEGNVIEYRGDTTSAIITCCDADVHDVEINNNWLAGGAYTLYLPNHRGRSGDFSNVTITNNRLAAGAYAFGYCSGWVEEMTEFSGNVIDDTGAAIASC